MAASLSTLKPTTGENAAVVERTEARVKPTSLPHQHCPLLFEEAREKDDLIDTLRSQVAELEARVLRRNEQIGSLQRQLKNVENDLARTRTNQMLAEETVVDLDAEKGSLLVESQGARGPRSSPSSDVELLPSVGKDEADHSR